MKRRKLWASACFPTFLMLSACVSSGTEVTTTEASNFKVGITTEQQVVAAIGQPEQTQTLPDGSKIDTYVHTSVHATAASYIPVVGLFAGGAKGSNDSTTFTFNEKAVLEAISSTSGHTDVHSGLLNQH